MAGTGEGGAAGRATMTEIIHTIVVAVVVVVSIRLGIDWGIQIGRLEKDKEE